MVRKSYNHPCVIIWAFLNECWAHKDEAVPLTSRLLETIHSLDPSRPVTYATCYPSQDKCIRNMDIIAINTYPDWYDNDLLVKDISAIGQRLQWLEELFPDKPLMLSEIGCGAIYGDHSGMRWSEEYHLDYVTTVLKEIKRHDRISGVSLWQFCDMRTTQTSKSILSTPRGFNNKGLVNEYRLPKMAWRAVEQILKDLI